MAINYCSVNSTTVNAFCGNQRAKVLARLLDEKYPIVQPPVRPPSGGSGDYGGDPTNPWYDPMGEYDFNIESPTITIRVRDLFGMEGEESQDLTNLSLEFVTVTNFELQELEEDESIDVQVSNLVFEAVNMRLEK